ncbi:HesB/IscA family protein [Geminocystis herdmanii]|uniref:HesB/IscA family protein n=1 Tax=Geminocystis herdmanii TaxID=669359 RepID=UPI00034DD114|nr:iron-sulfur cluster assembly accessory protein [Geminocystis herdmanii]
MINCTQTAIEELKRLKNNYDLDTSYVRIKIEKGGCKDYVYQLSFAQEIEENDHTISPDLDVTIVIDRTHYEYLENLTIDYIEDLMGGGFQFKNIDIKEHCTCGLSFKLEKL